MRITNTWKRPEKWVVVMLMLVFSLNFLGFAAAPKQVKIQVDGQTIALSPEPLRLKVLWKKPVLFFKKPTVMM